jgi:hypothetical protein
VTSILDQSTIAVEKNSLFHVASFP